MPLRFFVKFKYQSNAKISLGIQYSVRDLLFGVNNYA